MQFDNEGYFKKDTINKIANGFSSNPPGPPISFPIFIKCNDDSVAITYFSDLRIAYQRQEHNNYESMQIFFEAITKKSFVLDTNSTLYKTIDPRKICFSNNDLCPYHDNCFERIKTSYTTLKDNVYILNHNGLCKNVLYYIAYYFYINGYVMIEDDYSATISFRKCTWI